MARSADFTIDAGPVRIKTRGIAKGSKLLEERIRRLKSFRPLWRRNTLDFRRIEERWFLLGGRGEWPGLADSTTKARTRKLRTHRDGSTWFGGSGYYAKPSSQSPGRLVLVWTGEGKDSLTRGGGQAGAISQMSDDRMTFGTDSPQMLHNNKRRPVLDMDLLQQAVRENAQEWVFALVRGKDFVENRTQRF